jgi:DNA-binding SARP family transcriptional activator
MSLPEGVHLNLLGGFDLHYRGARISAPLGAQRLLAYLALGDSPVHRVVTAQRLWPDSSLRRAAANVRSALWQGRRVATETVIETLGPRLRLAPSVVVDLHEVIGQVEAVLEPPRAALPPSSLGERLGLELLPDWSDDWLTLERDRWDQTRLHALERLAEHLLDEERYLAALQTALGAVAIEPVREAAHRIVIEVHIAEGNVASALQHYNRYRALLQRELGVAPSPRMAGLVHALMPT